LAAEDHIVKTAGPVIYAQAVLVPELAVRLVKEDMGVDVDSARQILRESIEIGEKLNFAPNDVVPIPAESENADDIIV
jgi:translation elongation factor EF-Tu-like GTPase